MDASDSQPLVLVVDDDGGMNAYICAALASEFETVAAFDGDEALEIALRRRPELIITDILMPRMRGDDLLRIVRKTPELADVPVVLLTGRDDEDLRARLLREGAHDYLIKPFSEIELRARVHNLIAQRSGERLRAAHAVLTEEVRVKNLLLRTLSHELRSPLNTIIGFTQLMYDGTTGPVSEEQREFMGDVLANARHLLQLVRNVLDLASIEAGRLESRPARVELRAIIEHVSGSFNVLSAAKGITTEIDVSPDVESIVADPGLVQQILYNFLSNALKFTPDGGRVTIRAVPDGALDVRLEVEDEGPGVRPENVMRLFTEFQQQLHLNAASGQPGAGLGLAVTKRIVNALGGRVGVRSRPGKGSVFFAVLPRAAALEGQDAAAPDASTAS